MEIKNKRAYFDYEILEEYEAGIVLKGTEIKSIRKGKANLKDSYAIIRNNEAYLLNMHISHYEQGNIFNHDETRTRKLLLHKREIMKIRDSLETKGLTLIPLKLYFNSNCAKILIGLARGKKTYDKRESIKKRENLIEIKRELKNRGWQ